MNQQLEKRGPSGIEVTLNYIIKELDEIKQKLDKHYVSQEEFKPVKSIVYGLVTLVLTSVVVALIYLVVKR